MDLPETPAQCLCPLDRSDSSRSSKKIKERRSHDAHADVDNNIYKSNNNKSKIRRSSSPVSPISSPVPPQHPVLRRSVLTAFYDGGDAQKCIAACRQGFFDSLSSLSPSPSSSLADTCSQLSSSTAQQELWQLYWCDSAFCGVWIDAGGGAGQDPNVDLIINQCQNIGYSSIYDPGPPPTNYYCSSLLTAGPSANPCLNRSAVATETKIETVVPIMTTTIATEDRTQRLTTASGTPIAATSLSLGSIASAPVATGSRGASSSSDNDSSPASPSSLPSGPSAGVKGAIVVCVAVLVLLVAGIIFYFLRRHRNNMLGQQSYQHRGGGSGAGGIGIGGGSGPSRRPSHANNGSSATNSSVGLATRLRQQGQMLFYPGHGRGAHRDEVPTPLISPSNSCNSVHGVSAVAGMSKTQRLPNRAGAGFFAVFRKSQKASSSDAGTPPRTEERVLRSILPSFFSRRQRERSISPPLTSLSPPPSPTQMSARGRPDVDADDDGHPSQNRNRASAANSGSSYYGYYGYNGNFVPYYFPSSPICAPTTNKLEPRRERTPTIRPPKQTDQQKQGQQKKKEQNQGFYNFQRTPERGEASQRTERQSDGAPVPPLPPLPHSIFSTNVSDGFGNSTFHGLRSSYGSYSTASSAIIPETNLYGNAVTTDTVEPMLPLASLSGTRAAPSTTANSSYAGTTVSPVRPKHPHEGPLEIPDLVMPDPPPPPLFNPSNIGGRSFSMPATAFSVSSGGRRAPPRAPPKDMSVLQRGPPPTHSLPPPPPEKQDDMSSIESLELPPLLMRDDDDEEGDKLSTWIGPWRSASHSRHNYTGASGKQGTATASFSSMASTASILSSSTTETSTTATTATSIPPTSSILAPASSLPSSRQFSYGSPSTASSSLTIRPATAQRKGGADSDSLFPSRSILDSEDI